MNKINKLIALFVFLVVFMIGCQPLSVAKSEESRPSIPYEYKIIEVDGMHCVLLEGYMTAGLTCNWDEYRGE